MAETMQLDLPVVLPDADDGDPCVERVTSVLSRRDGIDEVHVVRSSQESVPSQLCVHFDPAQIGAGRIRHLAHATGAEVTDLFGHVLWSVSGVGHARRARSVADVLDRIEGVAEIDVVPGRVRLEFDRRRTNEEAIRTELRRHGVAIVPKQRHDHAGLDDTGRLSPGVSASAPEHRHDGDGEADHDHGHGGPFGERSEIVFAVVSLTLWIVGFIAELTDAVNDSVIAATFIVAAIFGGWFTLIEAVDSVKRGKFQIDFLMLVAAAGAGILQKWGEGALLLALFSIGHALEGYAMGRARRAIEALAELAPSTATVRRDDSEVTVPVEELDVGDVVIVRPNERLAADGFVLAGTTSIDQSALTGESIPIEKVPVDDSDVAAADPSGVEAGSTVFAGTINGSGQIDIVVTRPSADTTLSKLAQKVREAETQTSPTQQFTNRFERIFVPSVIVLVVVVMIVGPAIGSSLSDSFYRAMSVLVAASPCALAIATPSAVLSAIGRAGQLGVLIKGGGPLEHLGRINAVAFDKTGTLTEGTPRLVEVAVPHGVSEAELLETAVAVEARSDHPLAAAVVRDGSERLGYDVPAATSLESLTGRGVRAVIDGDEAVVGNGALFEESAGLDPDVRNTAERLLAAGYTIMIVKRANRFLGVLGLIDAARPKAASMIDELKALGVERAIMISGDNQLVADSVGREIGLTDVLGDLMPEDKVAAIERLRREHGDVAMVGDGVNDAPAMATATVGIAMGAAGSDVALETADIALMSDDLAKLPVVIGLGRRASRIIKQNLYMSLGMVAFLIPATLVGFVGIGPAVFFHEGSTLVVVANALRLLGYDRTPATRTNNEQ